MMADADGGPCQQPDHLSYLLRLWRAEGSEQPVWRASLRSASRGEQVGFASLEELFDYLRAVTEVHQKRQMP